MRVASKNKPAVSKEHESKTESTSQKPMSCKVTVSSASSSRAGLRHFPRADKSAAARAKLLANNMRVSPLAATVGNLLSGSASAVAPNCRLDEA
jgi:hypothetical protein